MTALAAYLPQDRLHALARNATLPDHCVGSALFADISGFTPLTETLRETLGPRRGAEELTKHLDAVYTVLIAKVEQFGGSVIGFAGDAITCWFDAAERPAAPRAVMCACALQTAMQAFQAIALPNGATAHLALKVSVASGPARRFVVGDPHLHQLDALAGATLERMAAGEHLAQRGEVIIDPPTVTALDATEAVQAWRVDEAGARFAVIAAWVGEVAPATPPAPLPDLAPAAFAPWMHPRIFEREQLGRGSFLTEFRPCVVVFVRFVGIDYDAVDAQAQLDAFIRQMQAIVSRYDGTLIDLTIGDKGSYAYIALGALTAHEDDARRAVKIALALREDAGPFPYLAPLQMGLTQGTLRTGAYGGPTRRTYGALGDEVNLAARLMQAAAPGEILVSGRVQAKLAAEFVFGPQRTLQLKGKAHAIPAFAVREALQQFGWRLPEPQYYLPMVGRQAELQSIAEKLALAQQQQAQIIGIVGEAGLGKSRLVAEVLVLARRKGFTVYGGACQSDGVNTPYLVWRAIWSAFFQLDPSAAPAAQIAALTAGVTRYAPQRLSALPLIGQLLNLPLADNDFTRALEAKYRQSVLRALLEDSLRAALQTAPMLIVIEDLHWIDALGHDLLDELAQALTHHPLCLLMVYRPPQLARIAAPRLEARPNFTRLALRELAPADAAQILRAKLAACAATLPEEVGQRLLAQAQGNPFYLEELLNYLQARGFDQLTAAGHLELPDSVHGLILSRIDRLLEREKITLKVASIIGRFFRVAWLGGYYPALGDMGQINADLAELARLDITPFDTPEPELAHLFKHIITHEVTYASLPYATRATLHEQLAIYLEQTYPEALPVETLAFHYERSANTAKKIEYLRRVGEAAQKHFANAAALEYYGKLLPLLAGAEAQMAIYLQRGQVLELMGQYAEAAADYAAALELAQGHAAHTAAAHYALGKLHRLRGEYAEALKWLAQALAIQTAQADPAGRIQVLLETGTVLLYQGEYAPAQARLNEGLLLARATGDQAHTALALNSLGIVARRQGNFATARTLFEESLLLRRAVGDKRGAATSLNNLGIVASELGDYGLAGTLYEESLTLMRVIGDKPGIAVALGNLGLVATEQNDYPLARALYEESLALRRAMGDKQGIAIALSNLGLVATEQGDYTLARDLYEESLALRRTMGDKLGIVTLLNNFGNLALAQNDLAMAGRCYAEGLPLAQAGGIKREVIYGLGGLAAVTLGAGRGPDAVRLAAASETLRLTLNFMRESAEGKIYETTLTAARAQLDALAFSAAWAEGAQWTLEEAVQKALAGASA